MHVYQVIWQMNSAEYSERPIVPLDTILMNRYFKIHVEENLTLLLPMMEETLTIQIYVT